MIEPISCAEHGVDLLDTHPYQKALIIGDGFEGQLIVQILKSRGLQEVTLAGTVDEKLAKNEEHFGFKTINNLTHPEEVQADSYDIVVEVVGLPKTQEQAVEAARRGGQVLMFGVGNPSSTFNVNTYKVYQRQLTIQGSFINPYTFENSVALLQSGDVDPLPLISNVLDFAHVEDFVSGKLGNISKAIVKVAGEEA